MRDIDIAIYPSLPLKELLNLTNKLEERVGIPIDLRPLDRIPPCMRYKILNDGRRLIVRDRKLFDRIHLMAFMECNDVKTVISYVERLGKRG